MANRNWVRWIHASVADYLKAVAITENIVSLVEGIEDRDDTFAQATDTVEFRVNGPYMTNPSNGYYVARVFVNVLVMSNMGGEQKNKYQLDTNLGIMQEALDQPINIYKCGPDTGDVDDGSHIGCMKVLDESKLGVRVIHFSQIDQTDRVKQAMVSVAYEIELQE
jgi:hypothetical protein